MPKPKNRYRRKVELSPECSLADMFRYLLGVDCTQFQSEIDGWHSRIAAGTASVTEQHMYEMGRGRR